MIYQQAQTVFVTALFPGATAVPIATVPEANTSGAYGFTSGKVAFIWTNPDLSQPGLGVSPLVIWTAAHGAQTASSNSPIGTTASASSADGEEVVFTSNASDSAGTQGDLVLASTDLSEQKTLVSNVPMLFGSGPCNPEAAFLGRGKEAYLAVEHCVGAATNATLSTFRGGVESDIQDLPPGPVAFDEFSASRRGRDLTTVQADSSGTQVPILVTENGVTTIDKASSTFSLFAGDGSVLYDDVTSPTTFTASLKRAVFHGGAPVVQGTVVPQLAFVYGIGVGSTGVTLPPTSPDGRLLAYAVNFNSATELSDLAVTNIEDGTTVSIDPAGRSQHRFCFLPRASPVYERFALRALHEVPQRREPGAGSGSPRGDPYRGSNDNRPLRRQP